MYDEIYTYEDKEKSEESKEEKMKFGFKDIVAMTLAAYQIVFVPLVVIALILIIIYLLFQLVM